MLAFLYVAVSILLGSAIVLLLKPCWENRINAFLGGAKAVTGRFLIFPASYHTGTLLLSWLTYFLAVAFRTTGNPLLYANVISLLLTAVFIAIIWFYRRTHFVRWFREVKKYGFSINLTRAEWFILISAIAFWSFFVCRSLYMDGDVLRAGISAFSDFGAHLPVIRSFSIGQNFPAQYPHFPDGTMRYHFMFYFMAGNLEYLGLNLPWALNLPSILSLVSFMMLLYGLTTAITKKTAAGLLCCFLFTFRSSFAFFTYSHTFQSAGDFFYALTHNLNADGSGREHIGNTLRESWGLWAQKVYVNQRHLAFAFGLAILVLFLLLPLFMETIEKVTAAVQHPMEKSHQRKHKSVRFFDYLKEILLTKDAWMPQAILPCIFAGILLGLTAFWNGAVVIAALSVLFLMAALSKHKLEYLMTAVITLIFSTMQSRLFVGSGTGAVSIQFKPGFLTESGNLSVITSYYVELLGLLPFALLAVLIVSASMDKNPRSSAPQNLVMKHNKNPRSSAPQNLVMKHNKKWFGYVLSLISVSLLIAFMPAIGTLWSIIIVAFCILFYVFLSHYQYGSVTGISPWLIPVFLGPILLATTLQLTPDITVNHKYIIFAVLLLNIPISDLLAGMLQNRKKGSALLAVCMALLLSFTGFVDMITLYNLDRNSVSYHQKDPVQLWAQNETTPGDLFLTHYMTHYGAAMSVLLAGRPVYHGYPYFTVTAGYETAIRDENMKKIYSAESTEQLADLVTSEGIDFIVIEDQNRQAEDYALNEELFYQTFPVAFEDKERNIVIFSAAASNFTE